MRRFAVRSIVRYNDTDNPNSVPPFEPFGRRPWQVERRIEDKRASVEKRIVNLASKRWRRVKVDGRRLVLMCLRDLENDRFALLKGSLRMKKEGRGG